MNVFQRFWYFWRNQDCISREEAEAIRVMAYQIGVAEGELRGRLALAGELAAMFPVDGRPFTPEDAQRIKSRQQH